MKYAHFKPKKIIFVLTIAGVLFSAVYGTFSYKQIQYGDVHLPTALSRIWQKYSTLAWYAPRFYAGSLAANAFTSFNTTEYTQAKEPSRAVPVLLYHGLRTGDHTSVTPDAFAKHMKALHEAGWKTVTQNELEAFLRGEQTLPKKSFLLTFDDGARDSYYPTDPILQLLGYNAVSFILPKYSTAGGTHYYLSKGEVNSMLESRRWEIGSHGQDSHEFLPTNNQGDTGAALANLLWLDKWGRVETEEEFKKRVTSDLRASKEDLEETYKTPITTFAFPFGEFGHLTNNFPEAVETVETIANDVYSLSFYQTWQGEGFSQNYPQPSAKGMLMVKRIEPKADTSAEDLLDQMEDGVPKDLPYNDDFTDNKGWFPTWGKPTLNKQSLHLKSQTNESGAAVVLDGTADWQDYHLRATVKSGSQTGFVVWVRFQDNSNNAGCNFGNGFIHAEDVVDGEKRVIKGTRSPNIVIPEREFVIDIAVKGREITCSLNDEVSVTTPFLDEALNRGGIGIKVWDTELGLAELEVMNISVNTL